jgi:predicted GNAT superfamily acetyltransferase
MIEIRALTQHDEFREAVQLQQQIWGFADNELLPLRLFVVATKIGGQAFGAFDGGRMVAFCLAIPGLKPGGQYYLHSHMLGTLPEYRNTGVGRRLKLAQRQDALQRSIPLIEWTFDPLELKNAYFNVEKLGAVMRRYLPNQYGTTSSHLHGGLPTDRLVAEWYIDSPRVKGIVDGQPYQRPIVQARIAVPNEISELRHRDPERAREIQRSAGEQFKDYFGRGLAVIGFEKSEQTGTYLLGPWE